MAVSGEKLSSCDSGKNNILSLLHSRKEKLRRERIKNCCEQLRALLPCEEGRKNDVASVLEATVAYMSCLQAIIPQDVAFQIAKSLRNNKRFSKRQLLSKDPAPLNFSPVPRNNAVLMIEPRSQKSEIFISKTKTPSFSTKADCYAGERTGMFQSSEAASCDGAQPNCYVPVLCLPAVTSLPSLPSLFFHDQNSTALVGNPNNDSGPVTWIESHSESDFHSTDCLVCTQSLPFAQYLLFPHFCKSVCEAKSATECSDL